MEVFLSLTIAYSFDRITVASALSPAPEIPNSHDLIKLKKGRTTCKSCYHMSGMRRKTSYFCSGCQAAMCQECRNSAMHASYTDSEHGLKSKFNAKYI